MHLFIKTKIKEIRSLIITKNTTINFQSLHIVTMDGACTVTCKKCIKIKWQIGIIEFDTL